MTFDDEALFHAHRRTRICAQPQYLGLVVVRNVWCRLLAGSKFTAGTARALRREKCHKIIGSL